MLFGGARALLMQAAHPLVVAGANQTGMYERDPWKRLQRTLILTYTMTFGTRAEADAAAEKINVVHTRINGVDPVTGERYDALDPELLLYVHACLVDSALVFERAHGRQARRRRTPTVPRRADARGRAVSRAARDDPADRAGAPRLARRHRGSRSVAGHRRRSAGPRSLPRSAPGSRVAPDPSRRVATCLRHASTADPRHVRPPVRAREAGGDGGDLPVDPRGPPAPAPEAPVHRPVSGCAIDSGSGGSSRATWTRLAGGWASGSDAPAAEASAHGPCETADMALDHIDGVLLDIDGVLSISWEPDPGLGRRRWPGSGGRASRSD